MTLSDMIYRRKSVRKYTDEPLDIQTVRDILDFCGSAKPLYPDIKVKVEVMEKEQVKCILPWLPAQVVAIFSEEKDGYLENAGFILQQLDLYLQTVGLGGCWLGMGKPDASVVTDRDDALSFTMMLAVGHPAEPAHREEPQFKRKALSEIADTPDERLEPARLAPSSVNSQPWFFTHEGGFIHAFRVKQGLFKSLALGDMNRIDMGIALAHMYVANPESFEFIELSSAPTLKGYAYTGSFNI